jgi:hypothetical protein
MYKIRNVRFTVMSIEVEAQCVFEESVTVKNLYILVNLKFQVRPGA